MPPLASPLAPSRLDAYGGGGLQVADFEPEELKSSGVAISLFAGAGGLDLGVEAAGFHVAAANEYDSDAATTLAKNFPHTAVDSRSIIDVPTRELLRAAGLKGRQRPDLLVGGPPCVAFSKSSFWLEYKRAGLDPHASMLVEYTRVLAEAQPRAFIMENVYALTYQSKQSKPHFDRFLREADEAGYEVTWDTLHAADHGVPQARPRLFVVGVRRKDGLRLPQLPAPARTGQWERRTVGPEHEGLPPHLTTQDAFVGLDTPPEPGEQVNGQYGHLLPDIPPGDNYLHYTARRGHPDPLFEWRSRFWSFLLKLDPGRPSPTIQAQPGPYVGPFHWDNRRLRIAEVKRLFTFPDDMEFVGNRSSVQAQLGNSVPPLLAYKVAREVARVLR